MSGPATPTPADARAIELLPCPFCAANLRLPTAVEYPHTGLARLHPGSVDDDECPLSGWGFYEHQLEAWNTRAALTAEIAEGAVDGWQPIETAPKDKRIIARGHIWGRFNNPFHLAEVVWDADSGVWRNAYDPDQIMKYLTEWLITVPATPVGAIAEGRE